MSKKLPKSLTKGGPGDKFLGDGKVDTTEWFQNIDILENQIKNQEIWFCTAPFQQVYTNTDGSWAPCSWATMPKDGPTIYDTPMRMWFVHNNDFNQLREEMTTPGSNLSLCKKWCKSCMKQENTYGRSRRQTSLKIQSNDTQLWPNIRNAVERFKNTRKGRMGDKVFEVQIKSFGNTCNLDCYMCMPSDSSTRLQTMSSLELSKQLIFNQKRIGEDLDAKYLEGEILEKTLEQIVKMAPYIYNLKLIGGEPLVMKQYYNLLDRIIESGYSDGIKLKYQTNMSILSLEKMKLIDYIPKFESFEFTISLDGIGQTNNYIRRRSNWNEIIENIQTISKYPNVKINVNGTISFLSVLRFYELIDWYNENMESFGENTQINWSNIRNPANLCANILPKELKEELIPRYKGFPDIQNVLKEDSGNLNYQDTLDYLLMNDKYYVGTKWEMHLFDVFPELEKFYNPVSNIRIIDENHTRKSNN